MNTHLIITKPAADEYPEWFAGEPGLSLCAG